jgi:hypothetical protein
MGARSISSRSTRPFIQPVSMHRGVHRTSGGQERDHDHDPIHRCAPTPHMSFPDRHSTFCYTRPGDLVGACDHAPTQCPCRSGPSHGGAMLSRGPVALVSVCAYTAYHVRDPSFFTSLFVIVLANSAFTLGIRRTPVQNEPGFCIHQHSLCGVLPDYTSIHKMKQ